MADQAHIELLRRDVDAWNTWRLMNPELMPDLSGAELGGADLVLANLTGANLAGANLVLANLRGADMRDADLDGANLIGARLLGVDLTGASLCGVDLSTAEDLTEEQIEETLGDENTQLPEEIPRPAHWLPPRKVNLAEAFASFSDLWSPKIAGEVNGMHVKLVKLAGEFVWHHHESEDELFLVVRGRLTMRFRDREIQLEPGEFLVVPRGVEHQPVAEPECEVMLIEPKGTLNTGNVRNERTVDEPDRLR